MCGELIDFVLKKMDIRGMTQRQTLNNGKTQPRLKSQFQMNEKVGARLGVLILVEGKVWARLGVVPRLYEKANAIRHN